MRVLVVPGAAVGRYARPAVAALRARGIDAGLLTAPRAPGVPSDLRSYGLQIAARMAAEPRTDLLVRFSVRRPPRSRRRRPQPGCPTWCS